MILKYIVIIKILYICITLYSYSQIVLNYSVIKIIYIVNFTKQYYKHIFLQIKYTYYTLISKILMLIISGVLSIITKIILILYIGTYTIDILNNLIRFSYFRIMNIEYIVKLFFK